MLVSVTHYDDITTPTGDIITMYMVFVQLPNRNSFCLAKRYSDFSNLYNAVKDYIPADYKFPNKSLFHNNAQFTKERRIRGFDELVKYLCKFLPFNPDFQAFIEMRDRLTSAEQENLKETLQQQAISSRTYSQTPLSAAMTNGNGSSSSQPRRGMGVTKSISIKSTLSGTMNSSSTSAETANLEEESTRRKLATLSARIIAMQSNEEDSLTAYEIEDRKRELNFRYLFQRDLRNIIFSVLKKAGLIAIIVSVIGVWSFSGIYRIQKAFFSFTSLLLIFTFQEVRRIRDGISGTVSQAKVSSKTGSNSSVSNEKKQN